MCNEHELPLIERAEFYETHVNSFTRDEFAKLTKELREQLAKAQTAVAVVERLKANATLVYDLLACRYEGLRDSEQSHGISDEDRSEMMTCLELTKLLEPWNEGPTLEAAVLGVKEEKE